MKLNAESVLITSDGIRNSLKKYKPLQALCECVWNGFDANASCIKVFIDENILSGTAKIIVEDNGTGIDRNQLGQKFKPFFQSEKVFDPEIKHSTTHGKNGVGRLTFFTFANLASWTTVYSRREKKYKYTIDINASALENYFPGSEKETTEPTGTIVEFSDLVCAEITADTARSYLATEFCWFLELNKDRGYSIHINDEPLDYSHLMVSSEETEYSFDVERELKHKVRFVCWRNKLTEYSKYYYIKPDGTEVAKENTTLNNKGDRFYHSVYIQSCIFEKFDFTNLGMPQQAIQGTFCRKSPEFEALMHQINCHLYDIRRPFIKESVSRAIENLEIEAAFPNYDPKNIVDTYRKGQIEELISAIYIAQPKLFTNAMNKEQKKTFIRMLDLIMDTGEIDSLFNILSEILEMDSIEREELSDILKYTRMSNITKTIRLLKDRYLAVSDLKLLLFNDSLGANEVKHIQKMIEKHYWLFGEQYNLVTAAEPNFEEALRRFLHYLHKEYEDSSITHPDKLKQMDIFAVRQDIAHNRYNNIVIELKHPNIALGETQLSQVKKYMSVILSNEQFNADNMTWEFYLIGNKFSNSGFIEGELESNKNHGEPHLVYKVKQYKIYVLRWSEIFAEFEMRHSFLNDKLKLEQERLQKSYSSADQIVAMQDSSTASFPPEMAHS